MGQERNLSTRISRFQVSQPWRGIVPIDGIQKEKAWISTLPGRVRDILKQTLGFHACRRTFGQGMNEVKISILANRFQKTIRQPHGDIKIAQAGAIQFCPDEVMNIRMIDPEDPHVGPTAPAALFDMFRGLIENFHEGHGP